ncbi:MAG: HAMP domain-containing histidine kinase [Deltaproteobacteria bacterium]|nr:HAMP domain-containing histidine kinase [Deltaproteobacteria bacterium]
MNRARASWLAFGLFSLILLGSIAGISLALLRAEQARAKAQQQAALEENVRLALWRMDSALAPLVAQEDARSPRDYLTSDVASPLIYMHFEMDKSGGLSSPRQAAAKRDRLRELQARLDRQVVEQQLEPMPPGQPVKMASVQLPKQPVKVASVQLSGQQILNQQQVLNRQEYQARNRATQQVVQMANMYNPSRPSKTKGPKKIKGPKIKDLVPDETGSMRALWSGGELLLLRRARLQGLPRIQGCWLDWSRLRRDLLDEVKDLLPRAELVPRRGEANPEQQRTLVALPLDLLPGALLPQNASAWSPAFLTLLLAWLGVLGALVATAILLHGILALSERRAAFVSAVTHELRTPLTTFRLYAEMLAEGMVQEPEQLRHYHRTLLAEAERLDHLVHNVLGYARLEQSRDGVRREDLVLGDLVQRIRPRLEHRLEQVGMRLLLEPESSGAIWRSPLRSDPEAIERILFNLVDNAAKYASAAEDKDVRLWAGLSPDGRTLMIDCLDAGPGLGQVSKTNLFRPFTRSAEQAAGKAPGVGLGLALSRRLARRLGGDLTHEPGKDRGTSFRLSLPSGSQTS